MNEKLNKETRKKQKNLENITNKQIDNFSNKLKNKAKEFKKDKKIIDGGGNRMVSQILSLMNREQRMSRKDPRNRVDWEEIAIEAMIKYYEQQEELGEE